MGNLCFSFITPVEANILPLDMRAHHNKILQSAFENLGVKIDEQGRNDLSVDGRKFSGSAFEIEMGGKKN